jgi:hypothetical protein
MQQLNQRGEQIHPITKNVKMERTLAVLVNPALSVPMQKKKKKKIIIGYINELCIFRAEKCRVYEHS